MENHRQIIMFAIYKWTIFYSYVKLPDGKTVKSVSYRDIMEYIGDVIFCCFVELTNQSPMTSLQIPRSTPQPRCIVPQDDEEGDSDEDSEDAADEVAPKPALLRPGAPGCSDKNQGSEAPKHGESLSKYVEILDFHGFEWDFS